MNYKDQIIDAFEASKIERILIVDDAYDAPEFEPQFDGDLLEILSNPALRQHLDEEALSDEDLNAAIEALNQNKFEDVAITTAIAALYDQYLKARENALDPQGSFSDKKGSTLKALDPHGFFSNKKESALESLDPLLELLRLCIDESKIKTVGGTKDVAAYRELKSDLILMDYFLSPDKEQMGPDWSGEASMNLLNAILEENPPPNTEVILMSSDKDVANLIEREEARGFGFLHKEWVSGTGKSLTAKGDAANVLRKALNPQRLSNLH